MQNKILLGHIFAIIVILFWGLTFVSSKVLLKDFTPIEMLFDRFLLATIALLVFSPKALKFDSVKTEFYAALVGFSGVTLYFVFENNALIYSNASNVCLIVSTAPFFVAILNHLLDKHQKLGKGFFVGFVIAMLGIACLSFGTISLKLNPLGDILALGSAIVWGIYNMFVVKLQRRGLSTINITIKSFFYAVVLTLPLMYFYGYEIKLDRVFAPINILNYLFLAVLASSAGFWMWNKSIECIGAVKTNIYIYATPVITAIGAVLLIDEKLTVYSIVGMILAISGLVISQIKRKEKK